MACNDFLDGLMSEDASSTPPRPSSGAIGAVSASIADLKSRAVSDIAPDLIDDGGVADRMDMGDIHALADSIKEHGQQVPVLLRPHPEQDGRYQVVYGRRRVAALRMLDRPVKAMVRSLTDEALILAQGQENAARRDLSFIEKANFARQLRDAGYSRKIICDALFLDKTVISRMLHVVDALPIELIEAIGAAATVGRDRWLALTALAGHATWQDATGKTSEARFDAALTAAQSRAAPKKNKPKPSKPKPTPLIGTTGAQLGHMQSKGKAVELTLNDKEFAEFVANALPDLFQTWRSGGKVDA